MKDLNILHQSSCYTIVSHQNQCDLNLKLSITVIGLVSWSIYFMICSTVWWESLANHSWLPELKPFKLVLTINKLLADLLIHQMLKKSNFTKLSHPRQTFLLNSTCLLEFGDLICKHGSKLHDFCNHYDVTKRLLRMHWIAFHITSNEQCRDQYAYSDFTTYNNVFVE